MKVRNRLHLKLFRVLSTALLLIFISIFFLYNFFAPKYLLFNSYRDLYSAHDEIISLQEPEFENRCEQIREKYGVVIVSLYFSGNEDTFNSDLRFKLYREKISLKRIWIIKKTIKKIENGSVIRRAYNQGDMKSTFLTLFFAFDNHIIAIGKSVPHIREFLGLLNHINLAVCFLAALILIVFIWFYSKKVTKPVILLKQKASEISEMNFSDIQISTGDEIEELAQTINRMSAKLSETITELNNREEFLRRFISDISHEIKTPLSIIKLYSHGIADNMDDGTFNTGILKQTEVLTKLTSQLISLSQAEEKSVEFTKFDLCAMVKDIADDLKILLDKKNTELSLDIGKELYVSADKAKLTTVIINLITNAIRYTGDDKVDIHIYKRKTNSVFQITNSVKENFRADDLDKICNPFFVMENSRNKDFCGSGLGLAIVKSILNRHGISYSINLNKKTFIFEIFFEP